MKRLPETLMLSCALLGAMLINAAFLSQNAVAASSEAVGITTRQERPGSRLAENKGAAAATDVNAALEALIKEDEERRPKAEKATDKTDTANAKPDGHSSLVNDETLYPTAGQCGECHKQIYEELSSSQHAYA